MRKCLCALMILPVLLLSGCSRKSGGDRADELLAEIRTEYLELSGCAGQAELTADYGQRVYTYTVDFTCQREGETVLTLSAPENVAGTTARIVAGETTLEYDGVMVETGPLDSDGLTSMGAIPALLTCIREGYLAECVMEGEEEKGQLHIVSRAPETTPGQGIETQLWIDVATHALLRGEVSQDGTTVLQCSFTAFSMENDQPTE